MSSVVCFLALIIQAQPLIDPYRFGNPCVSSLNTAELIGYWKMDEVSTGAAPVSRSDSSGNSLTLTDNGNTASTTGIITNAATFVAASLQFLSRTDSDILSVGATNYSVGAWVKLASKPATRMTIMAKWTAGTTGREYRLIWDNSIDRFVFCHGNSSGGCVNSTAADTFGAPALSTWYYVVGWHNVGTSMQGISVNGVEDTQASDATGVNGTGSFGIGALPGIGEYWNGDIDEASFFKKALTLCEQQALYNSGIGRTCCPFQ